MFLGSYRRGGMWVVLYYWVRGQPVMAAAKFKVMRVRSRGACLLEEEGASLEGISSH